jgi:thiopeptide-type bacteriocin biosynthesis protein
VNVRLKRDRAGVARARPLFDALAEALADWRRERHLTSFYFVRKPPDVRLRFGGVAPEPLGEALPALLDRLVARGAIARWVPAHYEPEVQLFGGPAMLPRVHAFFHVDSLAWMARARLEKSAHCSESVLSLAVLNDLFFACLEGSEEVWDVWCNLARLHRVDSHTAEPPCGVPRIAGLAPLMSPPERRILGRYARASRTLARALQTLAARGRLSCGRRGILPFIALFHWNRFGFSMAQRTRMLAAMTAALDPRARLRGGACDVSLR